MKRVLVCALAPAFLFAAFLVATVEPGALAAGTTAAKKGPGKCGEYGYWSTKDRKCMDARLKKG